MGLAFSAYVLPYAGYPYASAPVVAYAPLGKQKDIKHIKFTFKQRVVHLLIT